MDTKPDVVETGLFEIITLPRLCFVEDDDGHWYCIPVELKDDFEKWVYQEEEDLDDSSVDFDEYRLSMHVSNYSFQNVQDIKYD